MTIERTVNWWKVFLEEKFIGWQLWILQFREHKEDPISIFGVIRGIDVQLGRDGNYDLKILMPRLGVSSSFDPYDWHWSNQNPPIDLVLTREDFLLLEGVDGSRGGASFTKIKPPMLVHFLPPGAGDFLGIDPQSLAD